VTALAEQAVSSAALPHPYRVISRRVDTYDTVTLELGHDTGPLPAFALGQFAMLTAYGVGEVPISVSDLADTGDGQTRRLTHTLRAVGAVTTALHATKPGGVIGVRGPFGTTWDLPSETGRDLVIVAGGIGLAPLRPVVLAALANRSRHRRVTLLVGARTPADLLYTDELPRWTQAGIDVTVTVDRPDDGWTGHIGVVTTLIPPALTNPSNPSNPSNPANTVAFVCGPEVMMRFVAQALVSHGVPAQQVQVSLERNMRCGVGWCGHCQLGPLLVCRDGPVANWAQAEPLISVREL
jgi:NAD(P)H-flavin reductase